MAVSNHPLHLNQFLLGVCLGIYQVAELNQAYHVPTRRPIQADGGSSNSFKSAG